jgi:hypothetical protein
MTTTDLVALWAEYQAAIAEFEALGGESEGEPAWRRYIAAGEAIRAARPTDLAGLAIQVRLVADLAGDGRREEVVELAIAIAEQLEALAAVAMLARARGYESEGDA